MAEAALKRRNCIPRPQSGRGGAAKTMSDAHVLEARALELFAGWERHRIAARYPDVKQSTLYRILDGLNRVQLIAKPCHLPHEVSIL